jgi:exopolyphosphatase / guanosine-5'-triphosphate,3'-diphosphate pyrophosphatase
VLLHVLEALELDSITMSDFGVREGLVTDYLTNHAREISISGQAEDLRMRSALQVLQKFQPEEWQLRHSRHVAHLALELFDGLAIEHHLGPEERDVLQFAALLHDVGAAVGYDGHAEHSYYLIHNANLRGLSPDELERVALVARYHGKGRPRKRDPRVRALDKDARRSVRWLSAILRLAEALDRSHYQLVRDLKVHRRGKQFAIRVETKRGAQLEIWSARGRADQLERVLGRAVKISSARPAEREKRVVGSAARPATPAANGEPKRATPAPPSSTPASSAESGRAPAAPARSAIVPLRRRGA